MKKIILTSVLLILIVLFCSCGTVNIACSIDNDFNSEMNIEILIPKDEMNENEMESVDLNLRYLIKYWDDSGYDTDYSVTSKFFKVTLNMSETADSPEQAYDNLIKMMSADESPFSYVEGGYSPSYFNDIYNIKAVVDLTNLVDHTTIELFPMSQRDTVYNALEQVDGTLRFDLFGKQIDKNGNTTKENSAAELSLNEPVEMSMIMDIKNIDNQEKFDILENEILALSQKATKYTYIVAALAFCLVVALVLLVIFSIKNKKANKANRLEPPA